MVLSQPPQVLLGSGASEPQLRSTVLAPERGSTGTEVVHDLHAVTGQQRGVLECV